VPKTWSEDKTAYTAAELLARNDSAFENAREEYAQGGNVWEWRGDEALEDFEDNVLPALGLAFDNPKETLEYSIGNYNGGDYAGLAPHASLRIVDYPLFWHVLTTGESDTMDYSQRAPRIKIDRRDAVIRAIERGDFYLTFGHEDAGWYGHDSRSAAFITDDSDYSHEDLADRVRTLQDALTEWIDAIVQRIAVRVVEDVEYDTSEEGFLESSEANEWYYDEHGHITTPPDDAQEA